MAWEYSMQNRLNALNKWLGDTLTPASFSLSPLAGDASFRRYFRLFMNTGTKVVMDAPPEKESLTSYINVDELLSSLGVTVPKIHAANLAQGFLILDDFGDELLLTHLSPHSVDRLYSAAMALIVKMQHCPATLTAKLPVFDKQFMLQELEVFREWFLLGHLKLKLSYQEDQLLDEAFKLLATEISQQPYVLIHRDYHSRNIMLLGGEEEKLNLGILDFQDAMLGPFMYDLVSLLKDCYCQWPCEQVADWVKAFYETHFLAEQWTLDNFTRAFNLCGLQRHLKVLGVFSRLYLRDNKSNYLQNLPLTLHYTLSCLKAYPEFRLFYEFMHKRICLP
jgi:aminoglycoside/choline kinase family phosphotransferase